MKGSVAKHQLLLPCRSIALNSMTTVKNVPPQANSWFRLVTCSLGLYASRPLASDSARGSFSADTAQRRRRRHGASVKRPYIYRIAALAQSH